MRALSALCLLLIFPLLASATPKYARATKKACTTCHERAGKPELNAVGKCFQKSKHVLGDCEKKAKK